MECALVHGNFESLPTKLFCEMCVQCGIEKTGETSHTPWLIREDTLHNIEQSPKELIRRHCRVHNYIKFYHRRFKQNTIRAEDNVLQAYFVFFTNTNIIQSAGLKVRRTRRLNGGKLQKYEILASPLIYC